MNEQFNTATVLTKLGIATFTAAAGFGVGKSLEAKAETALGSTEKAAKAKLMAGYSLGGIAFAAFLWFLGTRMAKKNLQLAAVPAKKAA